MNFPVRTPWLLTRLIPGVCWHMPRHDKTVYLTFDDGPHPEITAEVLDVLAQYQAKATFFCVGRNVDQHPGILRDMLAAGHMVGNHTHGHLNGWQTDKERYLQDIGLAADSIQQATGQRTALFRPPYGRIGIGQGLAVAKTQRIVLWDVLPGDFVQDWSVERVSRNILKAGPGSIIVLHDSPKCHHRMLPALKFALQHFSEKGYGFAALSQG